MCNQNTYNPLSAAEWILNLSTFILSQRYENLIPSLAIQRSYHAESATICFQDPRSGSFFQWLLLTPKENVSLQGTAFGLLSQMDTMQIISSIFTKTCLSSTSGMYQPISDPPIHGRIHDPAIALSSPMCSGIDLAVGITCLSLTAQRRIT